ncbi:sulfotransferase family protein [Vreelandella subglaciescola]|jgi:hypothetical protein|nr:sulfotransferase family protein [Halomonas subglaciescola]
MDNKIFCIGFHKTGTTSIALALEQLGYKVTGPNGIRDPDIAFNALSMCKQLVNDYDAFQDNPWPLFYREMDEMFPGSKFILTLRDEQSWMRSQLTHFGANETPMRRWIYGVGCPLGNEETYLEIYRQHYDSVRKYFSNRPNDLLEMDLSNDDGWEELCEFLEHDIPDSVFPHVNKAVDRETKYHRYVGKLMRLLIKKNTT